MYQVKSYRSLRVTIPRASLVEVVGQNEEVHERKRVADGEASAGYRRQRSAAVAVNAVKPVPQPCARRTSQGVSRLTR